MLLALCLASPAFAIDVTYAVALRTDVRVRTPLPGDLSTTVTGDLELGPRAEVTLGGDTTAFFLQYSPTLIWREPHLGGRLLPLHRGRAAFTQRWERATLVLSEDGAYGIADVGSLRAADGSQPGAVAEVQTLGSIPYARSATLLALDTRPTDLFTLGFAAGFSISGSTQLSADLPLQYGPSGTVRARGAISRLDGLTTTAQVSSAHFATGRDQLVGLLSETWDRQVSRTIILNVGVGAALTREIVPELLPTDNPALNPIPGTYLDLLPVGLASLGWRDVFAGQPMRLEASLRIAPFSDRFTGNVYERLEARLAAEWRPGRDWTAVAATGGALALPVGLSLVRPAGLDLTQQGGDRLIFGEGTLTWAAQTWLTLQASARVLWTAQPRTGDPGLVQAVGTVSVTVHDQDSLAW